MTNKHQAILTSGPIGRTLIRLTLPMMVGMIGMVVFNLVDAYFIGKLGVDELAAMSFTLPIVMLYGSISTGLGVGTASIVSRLIGGGNHAQVKRQTTDSILLSLLIVIFVVVMGIVSIRPLFSMMGAEGRILDLTVEYMTIWYLGVAFVVIPMVGNNAIRAAGNTLIPTVIMAVAALINCILDPLLIFGIGPFPEMRMAGAALATVIARASTLGFALYFLHYKFDMLTLKTPAFRELLVSWKEVLYIGIPAALTMVINPLALGIITKLVATFSKEAVAALGIANRVEMFALSPFMALSAVLLPFIGQNLGAHKLDRIKHGISMSQAFAMIVGLAMFIFFIFFRRRIGGVFGNSEEVLNIFGSYILIVSSGYGLLGIFFINNSVFNAIKQPIISTSINIVRMCVLYIPLAWLLSRFFQLNGIFWGALVSTVISGVLSVILARSRVNKIIVNQATNS